MKHTPGPWEVLDDGGEHIEIQPAVNPFYTVAACPRYVGPDFDGAANARLIARAPEMDAEIARLRAFNAELVAALTGLIAEAEDMNADLRHVGKGRPDGGAHPDSPIEEARAAIARVARAEKEGRTPPEGAR